MWAAFQQIIFDIINWFYLLCHDWGLAIILITILIRLILYPISRKQYQSSYLMQKMQPKLNEIKVKYAGDQQRISEEQMKLYQEAKFNPLMGCLPALAQMPIVIALFWVLRDLNVYINPADLPATFYGILPDITASPGFMFSEHGLVAALPYLALMALFSVSMLVPMLINKTTDRNQLIMIGVMSVVMLWFGWTVSGGVLLYWVAQSYIGVAHQLGSKKMLEAKDARTAAETPVEVKPVKVEVERKTKKNRPKKSK